MNAKEAREKAKRITGDKEKSQYGYIKNRIKKAVDLGHMTTYFYESILPAVNLELEKEGFKLSEFSDMRDGVTITISWDEKGTN